MKEYRKTGIKPNYGALISALPFFALSVLLVPAQREEASAGRYFEGTAASCITVLSQTPVEVKSVSLSFSVPCFGACSYGEEAPSVKAEYAFFNATPEAQTVSLAFPYELIKYRKDADEWNKKENCALKTEGEPVDYSLRYTYRGINGFDAAMCAGELQDDDAGAGFYKNELPVTKYVYAVTLGGAVPSEEKVKLFLKGDASSKLMRANTEDGAFIENGYRCLCSHMNANEGEFTYYALGGNLEVDHAKRANPNAGVEYRLVSRTQTTFEALIEERRPEEIAARDWHRIVVDYFNDTEVKGALFPVQDCLSASFVRWYIYDITVPAGATVTHTVRSPFYPSSSPNANYFSYQLSPLKAFPKFGEISVTIETPYRIAYSNVEMKKTEHGYEFERDDLPYDELSFVFEENGAFRPLRPEGLGFDPLTVALCILAAVVAAGVVLTVVIIVKNKRLQRQRELLRQRADMGRPEEGVIDENIPSKKDKE